MIHNATVFNNLLMKKIIIIIKIFFVYMFLISGGLSKESNYLKNILETGHIILRFFDTPVLCFVDFSQKNNLIFFGEFSVDHPKDLLRMLSFFLRISTHCGK